MLAPPAEALGECSLAPRLLGRFVVQTRPTLLVGVLALPQAAPPAAPSLKVMKLTVEPLLLRPEPDRTVTAFAAEAAAQRDFGA